MEKKLAAEFTKVLREWLSKDEWNEMVEANKTPDYSEGSCASHNYCDANEAMLEAMVNLEIGAEFDPANEKDCKLWNDAWEIARSNWA